MFKSKFLKLLALLSVIALLTSISLFGCAGEEVAEEAEEVAEEAEEVAEEAEEVAEEAEEVAEKNWVKEIGIEPSGRFVYYSYDPEGGTIWTIVQMFAEAYPDVEVEYVSIPGADFAGQVAAELESGVPGFDAFFTWASWTQQFYPFMEDVTDRIPEELKEDVVGSSLVATSFGDRWYGVPLFNSIYVLTYNKEILAQQGYDKPPETWDEAFKCAEDCTIDEDGDGIPEIYGWSDALVGHFGLMAFFALALKTVGGSYWNYDRDNPKALFNNDDGVRVLQLMKKVYRSDFTDPVTADSNEEVVRRSVASGAAAMGLHCFGPIDNIAKEDFPENLGKFGYAPVPIDPGGESHYLPGPMGTLIRKGGNVDAALAFSLFCLSKEVQKFMIDDYGFPVCVSSLEENEDIIAEYPYVKEATEMGNKYKGERYVEGNEAEIETAYYPIFENYLNGGIDEETALSEMEEIFYDAWEE
jgi:multiple sugar transport system substrate-binding protein